MILFSRFVYENVNLVFYFILLVLAIYCEVPVGSERKEGEKLMPFECLAQTVNESIFRFFTRISEREINDFYSDAWLTVIIQFRNAETIFYYCCVSFGNVEWRRQTDFALN